MRKTSKYRGKHINQKSGLRISLLALTFSAAFNFVETADAWIPPSLISTFLPSPIGSADDEFGSSIAVNGATVAIGIPGFDSGNLTDVGAVQVYNGTSTAGVYNCVQTLESISGPLLVASSDNCGSCVAISPNWIAAGAKTWDRPEIPIIYNAGAVFIWKRESPNTWLPTPWAVRHDNPYNQDKFGTSVALQEEVIDGVNIQTLAVGTPTDDLGNGSTQGAYANRGSVSIYKYDDKFAMWTLKGFIPAFPFGFSSPNVPQTDSDLANGYFGISVAINGNYMVIGAHRQSVTKTKQGTAFLFRRGTFVPATLGNANKLWGEWHFVQRLLSANPKADDQFGWSTNITSWNIIVGAPAGVDSSINETGSVSIWRLDQSDLLEPAKDLQTFSGGNPSDQFGYSVLIRSQSALIGAVGVDTGNVPNTGRVYQFKRYSTACNIWTLTDPIIPPSLAIISDSRFGTSLELGDNCVLVSAPKGNNQALVQGVTFAFTIPESTPPCDSDLNGDGGIDGTDLSIFFSSWGSSNSAADFNHDGVVNGADLPYLISAWGACICGGG